MALLQHEDKVFEPKHLHAETPTITTRHTISSCLAVDNEYLLRCALIHDWDAIIHFCESLSSANFSAKEARTAQDKLQVCDHYGNSVVQLACYHRPPVSAIRSMIAAATQRRALVRHRATDGSTALQVACATGASIEVVDILVAISRDLVAASDQQGSSPISELTLQYSLERMSPCYRRQSLPLDKITTIQEELAKKTSTLFHIFWAKFVLLLDIDDTDDVSTILGQTASLAHTIPTELTDLLLRSYSMVDIIQVFQIAINQKRCHHLIQQRRQEYFLTQLLQTCPRAAASSMFLQDGSNSFPLAIAVQRGYSFRPVLCSVATLAPDTISHSFPAIAESGRVEDVFCILRLQPQVLNECRRWRSQRRVQMVYMKLQQGLQ